MSHGDLPKNRLSQFNQILKSIVCSGGYGGGVGQEKSLFQPTLSGALAFSLDTVYFPVTSKESLMVNVASCSKCSGAIECGFLLNNAGGMNLPMRWVEGPLEPSFWGGVKAFRKVKRVVKTYRCVQCGFLESYATVEFNKQWLQNMDTE